MVFAPVCQPAALEAVISGNKWPGWAHNGGLGHVPPHQHCRPEPGDSGSEQRPTGATLAGQRDDELAGTRRRLTRRLDFVAGLPDLIRRRPLAIIWHHDRRPMSELAGDGAR